MFEIMIYSKKIIVFYSVLDALFIPKYGASSAAVASLISEVIDLVLRIHFAETV